MTSEEDMFAQWEQEMAIMPCESDMHESSPAHAGPGAWYVTYACPRCKDVFHRALICDRYHSFLPVLKATASAYVIECDHCKQQFLDKETIIVSERRRV